MDESLKRLGSLLVAWAIRVWSGQGESAWPRRDDKVVVDVFGEDLAIEILPTIRLLQGHFYESEARRHHADIWDASSAAAHEFRRRYPQLPPSVADDFAWCYAYDFK
jgi:hypothetical protein